MTLPEFFILKYILYKVETVKGCLLYGFKGHKGSVKNIGEFDIAVSIIDIKSCNENKYLDLCSIKINVLLFNESNGLRLRLLSTRILYFFNLNI